MNEEAASGIFVKMLPTSSIAVMSLWGIPLQQWTYIVAIAVGVCQCIAIVYGIYRKYKTPIKTQEEESKE